MIFFLIWLVLRADVVSSDKTQFFVQSVENVSNEKIVSMKNVRPIKKCDARQVHLVNGL